MMRKSVFALAAGLVLGGSAAWAGTWTKLTNLAGINVSTMFLMMDGRVLAHNENTAQWKILTPDQFGSYVNGTWSNTGSTRWTRLYFASGVFPNGKVIVCGGEYSNAGNWTNKTEVYDPLTGTWTEISPPPGWAQVGDAPNVITEDGRFYIGNIFDTRTAFYNVYNNTWTAGPGVLNARNSEETWILLPDKTALKWDCFGHPHSQKWVPSVNQWRTCGNTPVDLVLPGSFETGAAVLLPDGRTFCIGGPPKTALYTMPSNPLDPGTWTIGPSPQKINNRDVGAEDAPAAMIPDGHVLVALGPVTANGGTFESPTYFFEFDGTNLVRITDPPSSGEVPYRGHMLNLPNGEILWANGRQDCYVYTNGGVPQASWRPVLTNVPTSLQAGATYVAQGKQLNGVTNGSSYGDECYTATNYPIVRLTDTVNNRVYYCRTFDPSTMGVQTGNLDVSVNFVVPSNVPNGQYKLQVIASGIASDPVIVGVGTVINVSSFSVLKGTLSSGGLSDLNGSDNLYVRILNAIVTNINSASVQVEFIGTSPNLTPTALAVQLETAQGTTGITQVVEAFNYQTNQYEQLDSRPGTTQDSAISLPYGGNVARFIDQQNGQMKLRVSFNQTGPAFLLSWLGRFDAVNWLE